MVHNKKFILDNNLINDAWSDFKEIIFPETFTKLLIFILSSVEGAKYVSTTKDEQHEDAEVTSIIDKVSRTLKMDYPPKPMTYFTVDGNETTKEQRSNFHKTVRKHFGTVLESQTVDGTLFLHLSGDHRFSFSKTNFVALPPKNQPQEPVKEAITLVETSQVVSATSISTTSKSKITEEEPSKRIINDSPASLVPLDVLSIIFWYLDSKDLIRSTQVCRRWNAASETVYKNAIFMKYHAMEDWNALGQSYKKLFQKQVMCRLRWFQRGAFRTSSISTPGSVRDLLVMDNHDTIRLVCNNTGLGQDQITIFKWTGELEHSFPNVPGGKLFKIDDTAVISVPPTGNQLLIDVITGEQKNLHFNLNPAKLFIYAGRYIKSVSAGATKIYDLKSELLVLEVAAHCIFDAGANEILALAPQKMTAFDISTGKQKRTMPTELTNILYVWHEVFYGYIFASPHIVRVKDMTIAKTMSELQQYVFNKQGLVSPDLQRFAVVKDKLITMCDRFTVYSLPSLEEIGSSKASNGVGFKTDGTRLVTSWGSYYSSEFYIYNLNNIIQKPDTVMRGSVWNLMTEKGLLLQKNTLSLSQSPTSYDFNDYVLAVGTSSNTIQLWDFTIRNYDKLMQKPSQMSKKKKHSHFGATKRKQH